MAESGTFHQTIKLSSKRSDGVIGHARQKQYNGHEMNDVETVQHEYTGVNVNTSEAWHHHESPQSTTDRKEGHIQEMLKYIEYRWSPLYAECPPLLNKFVT